MDHLADHLDHSDPSDPMDLAMHQTGHSSSQAAQAAQEDLRDPMAGAAFRAETQADLAVQDKAQVAQGAETRTTGNVGYHHRHGHQALQDNHHSENGFGSYKDGQS